MTCPKCNGDGHFTIVQGRNSTQLKCSHCFGTGEPVPSYAGVGARLTPTVIAQEMSALAMQLAMRGYGLRSGGAKRPKDAPEGTGSADQAFEQGCDMMRGHKAIRGATGQQSAHDHAALYHPAWDKCSDAAKSLHARNSLVMLGDWLDTPVTFVVCYTPRGAVVGGTGQSLRIAAAYSVPVFNLAVPGHGDALREWLG